MVPQLSDAVGRRSVCMGKESPRLPAGCLDGFGGCRVAPAEGTSSGAVVEVLMVLVKKSLGKITCQIAVLIPPSHVRTNLCWYTFP